jgi:hypothetical protein
MPRRCRQMHREWQRRDPVPAMAARRVGEDMHLKIGAHRGGVKASLMSANGRGQGQDASKFLRSSERFASAAVPHA